MSDYDPYHASEMDKICRRAEADWRARAEKAEAELDKVCADRDHFLDLAETQAGRAEKAEAERDILLAGSMNQMVWQAGYDEMKARAEAAEKRAADLVELAEELIAYTPKYFIGKHDLRKELDALLAPRVTT